MIDFGAMPISNAFLRPEDVGLGEMVYPLRIMACASCHLVQLADGLPAGAHFHERYAYFSSFSSSWLAHCKAYADQVIERFRLQSDELILEVASNDGYLLGFFKERGIPTLGVEPSESVARAARAKGIPTETKFFGLDTARELRSAGVRPRLIVANNVFAHVPDLNDFAAGFACLLQDDAVLTLEVHYFGSLFRNAQFDSFYHEHYCYYTIGAVERLLARHGLRVFDVEQLPTHGGSIRLYACQRGARHIDSARLSEAHAEDDALFVESIGKLEEFRWRIDCAGADLRRFLVETRRAGKRIAGFGAPAKATTFLNHARITRHLLPYTVDNNPSKQGLLIPGVHVPIVAAKRLEEERPDFVLILPWNLRAELLDRYAPLRRSGTRFVIAVPALEIV